MPLTRDQERKKTKYLNKLNKFLSGLATIEFFNS